MLAVISIISLILPYVLLYDYQVIVIGGGEAGVAAAIQARRLGLETALIEESDYIGGMMTAAGVTSMDGNFAGFHRTGMYKEFTDKINAYYESIKRKTGVCYWSDQTICFEPKVGENILRKMLDDAWVSVYEKTYPISAFYRPGTKILEKILFSNGATLSAKVFIDATEFGDVLEIANVKHRAGNSTSDNLRKEGCVQKFTWTAVMKQYDNMPEALKFRMPPPGFKVSDWTPTVTKNGSNDIFKYPWSWDFFKQYRGMPDSTRPGRNDLTKTGINIGANDLEITVGELDREFRDKVLCEGKLKTLQFMYYIQKYLDDKWSVSIDEQYNTTYTMSKMCPNIPAEFKIFEMFMPVIPYIRESRRVIGLYTLTLNDTFRTPQRDAKTFEDSVAIGDYEEDLHQCLDYEKEFNENDPFPSQLRKAFEIPMRSLIPEKVDALLTAGKTISVSRLTNGASRNQPISMLTGQAAGVIAAIAAKKNIQPRQVDYKEVQQILKENGVIYKANPKAAEEKIELNEF